MVQEPLDTFLARVGADPFLQVVIQDDAIAEVAVAVARATGF